MVSVEMVSMATIYPGPWPGKMVSNETIAVSAQRIEELIIQMSAGKARPGANAIPGWRHAPAVRMRPS
ncbi:MAG: hypothetical protein L0H84_22770 [Pseudonocardia sp.]|nr:hypothetical protein [Pseudonocardia sp.]